MSLHDDSDAVQKRMGEAMEWLSRNGGCGHPGPYEESAGLSVK